MTPTTPSLLRLCKQILNEPKLYGDAVVVARWAMERLEAEPTNEDLLKLCDLVFGVPAISEHPDRYAFLWSSAHHIARALQSRIEAEGGPIVIAAARCTMTMGAAVTRDGTREKQIEVRGGLSEEYADCYGAPKATTPQPERVTEQKLATLLGTICHKRPMEMARAILQRFGNRLGGEWMPIESAPRNRTRIIATDGLLTEIIYWSETVINPGGVWLTDAHMLSKFPPTQWQPLPNPPGGST